MFREASGQGSSSSVRRVARAASGGQTRAGSAVGTRHSPGSVGKRPELPSSKSTGTLSQSMMRHTNPPAVRLCTTSAPFRRRSAASSGAASRLPAHAVESEASEASEAYYSVVRPTRCAAGAGGRVCGCLHGLGAPGRLSGELFHILAAELLLGLDENFLLLEGHRQDARSHSRTVEASCPSGVRATCASSNLGSGSYPGRCGPWVKSGASG